MGACAEVCQRAQCGRIIVETVSDSVPIISLAQGDVRALREACEEHGFFYVSEHGVPGALERRLEAASRKFFELGEALKSHIAMPLAGAAWRGWFPVNGELTSGHPDLKEGLYFGDELPVDSRPMHGPNLFPAQVPELRDAVLAFMAAQAMVGQKVLSLVARSLELPYDFFATGLMRQPLSLFRIFHYPAPLESQRAQWGVGEHTDYGLLTLLKQDDCGGLEVKTPSGWISAPPIDGTFVCNLGDMLDRMTGGRYRSTPHRVRNSAGRSRYSWPFFFDPSFDAEVRPLPFALKRPVEQDAAERWDASSVHDLQGTYGDYLRSKVAKVFPDLNQRVSST